MALLPNPNFSVHKDATLRDVNATSLQVAGNLTVGGSIAPGTFTNRVVVITGAGGTTVLTANDSGSVLYCNMAAAQGVTLPAPTAGVNYKFIITSAASGNALTVNCGAGLANAVLLNAAGAIVTVAASQNIILGTAANNSPADYILVQSNGVAWYAQGRATLAAFSTS